MSQPLKRIGLIGLDTSHAIAFTQLLNDPSAEFHVPGGKVVAAYPGGSPDFPLSASRVQPFTAQLRDKWGVEIVDSPEAVAELCDLVFILSVDGRTHRSLFDRVAPFGKPLFIDKPLAVSVEDAQYIISQAEQRGIPFMSSSALRYGDVFVKAIGDRSDIIACDVFGPMDEEPTQPGLFWYGIHSIEMLVAAMGPGCTEVRACRREHQDLVQCIWNDGRLATVHGLRGAHSDFGLTVHRKDGFVATDSTRMARPFYAGLLETVIASLSDRRWAIPSTEILEVMRIIHAANISRKNDAPVKL